MSNNKGYEVIEPPTNLRGKIGGNLRNMEDEIVAQAEKALAGLENNFYDWVRADLEKLVKARKQIDPKSATDEDIERFSVSVHDLKGLGKTYGYPMVSRFCASLYDLLTVTLAMGSVPWHLIDAHINAIQAVVRDDIKDDKHKTAVTLAASLEELVKEYMDAHEESEESEPEQAKAAS